MTEMSWTGIIVGWMAVTLLAVAVARFLLRPYRVEICPSCGDQAIDSRHGYFTCECGNMWYPARTTLKKETNNDDK